MAFILCHILLVIWIVQTEIQFQEFKNKQNARKGKYNTCIISMMLPILCWYARRCRQFRVWNISYKFPTSWIKKTPIIFYFWHWLIWKSKTIKESNELSPFICSIEQNGFLSQFTNFETDSGRHGRAETWQWHQAAWAEKRTSCSFSSPSPKPHSPLAQKTWSTIMHSWWFCSLPWRDPPQALSNRGLLCPTLP